MVSRGLHGHQVDLNGGKLIIKRPRDGDATDDPNGAVKETQKILS